jgi:hypothetical protein
MLYLLAFGQAGVFALNWADFDVKTEEASLAAYLYNILFPIGVAIGIFGIIQAGYAYLTSQGRPDKTKEANEKLTSAILGILFIILSIVILRIIIRTLIDPDAVF